MDGLGFEMELGLGLGVWVDGYFIVLGIEGFDGAVFEGGDLICYAERLGWLFSSLSRSYGI